MSQVLTVLYNCINIYSTKYRSATDTDQCHVGKYWVLSADLKEEADQENVMFGDVYKRQYGYFVDRVTGCNRYGYFVDTMTRYNRYGYFVDRVTGCNRPVWILGKINV